jgi:hypothetical protein
VGLILNLKPLVAILYILYCTSKRKPCDDCRFYTLALIQPTSLAEGAHTQIKKQLALGWEKRLAAIIARPANIYSLLCVAFKSQQDRLVET